MGLTHTMSLISSLREEKDESSRVNFNQGRGMG